MNASHVTLLVAQQHFLRNMLDAMCAVLTIGLFIVLMLFENVVRRSTNPGAMREFAAKLPKFALLLIGWSIYTAISACLPGTTWLRAVDGLVGCAGIVGGVLMYRRLKAQAL